MLDPVVAGPIVGVAKVERLPFEHRLTASRAKSSDRVDDQRSSQCLMFRTVTTLGSGAWPGHALPALPGGWSGGPVPRRPGRRPRCDRLAGVDGGVTHGLPPERKKPATWAGSRDRSTSLKSGSYLGERIVNVIAVISDRKSTR